MNNRLQEPEIDQGWVGRTCPYCQMVLKPDVTVVICPACGTYHHRECWETNRGCAVYGCEEANALGPAVPGSPQAEYLFEPNPWDQRQAVGLWRAYFRSAWKALTRPREFYSAMPVRGGFGSPVGFAVLTSVLTGAVMLLFQLFGVALMTTTGGISLFALFPVAMSVLIPLYGLVALFIFSGLRHLCLMMLGGNRFGFEATLRVEGFAFATQLVGLVPCVGPLAAVVWNVVLVSIGLSVAHKTTMGKAVAATLLPFVLPLGCVTTFVFTTFLLTVDWV